MLPLIDGDTLAYLSCKSRYSDEHGVIHITSVHERPVFTQAQDALYLEESWDNLCKHVKELRERFYATDHLMAVKGPGNYRDIIYPVQEVDGKLIGYKSSRVKKYQNTNTIMHDLRQRMVDTGMAIYAYGREADDMLRIWANECRIAGVKYVVVAEDKDLRCIGGRFFNPKTNELFDVNDKEGLRFYYEQLVMGDATDSIPGIPGLGPKKAASLLAECDDEDEFQFMVVTLYKDAYGDGWRDQLLSNGKLLYIQQHVDDYFTLKGWPV